MSELQKSKANDSHKDSSKISFPILVRLISGYALLSLFWIIAIPVGFAFFLDSIAEPTISSIAIVAIVAIIIYKIFPWKMIGAGFRELKDQIKNNF